MELVARRPRAVDSIFSCKMIDETLRSLDGDELADAWVEAFHLLAADYQNRNLLATVELIGDELKARGCPSKERVTSEMDIYRAENAGAVQRSAPAGIAGVRAGREDDLMSFVARAERARRSPNS